MGLILLSLRRFGVVRGRESPRWPLEPCRTDDLIVYRLPD